MSEIEKGLRLHKIAKELNIGTATITEFLGKKGFVIENKPTAKISDDMYSLLLKEYQGDKSIKEEANQISIGKIRREELVVEEAPKPVKTPISREEESDEILIKNIATFKPVVDIPPVKTMPTPPVSTPANASGNVLVNVPVNIPVNVSENVPLNSTMDRVEAPKVVVPIAEVEIPKPSVSPIIEPKLEVKPSLDIKLNVPAVEVPGLVEKPLEKPIDISPQNPLVNTPASETIQAKAMDSPETNSNKVNEIIAEKKSDKEIPEKVDEVPHLKIVGKIDLSSFTPKPKGGASNFKQDRKPFNPPGNPNGDKPVYKPNPSPTQHPQASHPRPQGNMGNVQQNQAPKPVEASMNQSESQVETEVMEKPSDLRAADDKAQEPVRINTNFQKLSGPSIIGKIELPVDKKNQRVASSNAALEQAKKKRKRKESPPNNRPNNTNPAPPDPNKRQDVGRPLTPFVKKDDKPKVNREEPTDKEIQDQIKATLARLSGAGKSGKFAQRAKLRRQKRDDVASAEEEALMEQELQSKILKVTEFVTANELAKLMDVAVNQIISTCMSLGLFVSINQRLDAETLTIVAEEFGFQVEFVNAGNEILVETEEDAPETLVERAPIVTVMGHVDHGKTSLLDYIRNTNVIGGEAGGITQHIGAYEVKLENGKKITFLDTPGHEAFTAMRARGAQSTDIVIIVVAADDAVMPQTIEAINHAQAAGVPMVFAFNKMDREGANPDKIREQLANMNILVEEWGGKYQTQEISARKGTNIDVLLDKVLLEAELLELKANPNKRAVGSVIEASLDKGRGIVTTVLVQSGTLRVGDPILAGCYSGRVKALFNERQQKVVEAGPSSPVLVLGMQGSPQAGDKFLVMESEVEAREIANKRLQLQREQGIRTQKHITLDEIGRRLAIGNFKELNIIVKGDVDGSIEALSDSLLKLSTPEIQVNILHKSVGQISESDVLLATASDAIIIGFQVRPSGSARKLAEMEQIDIRLYSIIYDAINEIKSAMEGMLSPVFEEKIVCNIEIREIFKISKVGTIAGCYVLDGKITRNTKIRIIRDGVVVHTGELDSLKRFKDDVKEVSAGYECGLNIKNFNDLMVGDIIEGFEQVEVKRKL